MALAIGLAIECYGFTLRVMISGWAPVTNMYETVIWVALVTSVLGLVLELISRKTFAALAASGDLAADHGPRRDRIGTAPRPEDQEPRTGLAEQLLVDDSRPDDRLELRGLRPGHGPGDGGRRVLPRRNVPPPGPVRGTRDSARSRRGVPCLGCARAVDHCSLPREPGVAFERHGLLRGMGCRGDRRRPDHHVGLRPDRRGGEPRAAPNAEGGAGRTRRRAHRPDRRPGRSGLGRVVRRGRPAAGIGASVAVVGLFGMASRQPVADQPSARGGQAPQDSGR